MSRDEEKVWDVIIFNEIVRRRRRKRAARPKVGGGAEVVY